MVERAADAHRGEEARVEAFHDQRPIDGGEADQGQRRRRHDEEQRRLVDGEDRAEQDVHEIDRRPAQGDDENAQRHCRQIGGGEARILAHARETRDDAREQRRGDAGNEAAETHRRQGQATDQETHGGAGQQRVRQCIAHQAHAAQDQEHADRRAADRQREARDQGAAHEAELGEGRDHIFVEHDAKYSIRR